MITRYTLLLLSFFLFSGMLTTAQTHKIDSLLNASKHAPADTLRINALNKLAFLVNNDTVLIRRYATDALTKATKIGYPKGQIQALISLGYLNTIVYNEPEAIRSYEKGIAIAKQNGLNTLAARVYRDYALVYKKKHQYQKAIALNDSALRIFLTVKDTMQLLSLYGNMGNIFANIKQVDQSVAYHLRSLRLAEKKGSNKFIAMAYNNISTVYYDNGDYERSLATCKTLLKVSRKADDREMIALSYQNMGSAYLSLKKYSEALACMKLANPIERKENYESYLTDNLMNTAQVLNEMHRYAEAMPYNTEAVALATKAGDDYTIALTYLTLSATLSGLKKYPPAERYLKQALQLEKTLGDEEVSMQSFAAASEFYHRAGDYRKAFQYRELENSVKDSLLSAEKHEQIVSQQIRYETEKKELENQRLQNDRDRAEEGRRRAIGISIAGFIALLIIFFLAYRIKQSRDKFEEEQNMNRAVFEGEQKERIRIARDLHDSIGQMLSVVKMNVSTMDQHNPGNALAAGTLQLVDKTIGEVRTISHNLIPEALNFGLFAALDDLCTSINKAENTLVHLQVPDEVKEYTFTRQNELSVYRIIQEVLNNMVKHAKASEINLGITLTGGRMVISITDNGQGFDTGNIPKSGGLGWKNISARVHLLDGKMKVQSEKLAGTQIEINLPV